MPTHVPGKFFAVLRVLGSLRLAAVVLMLLLVALGCATIFESTHGTEQALSVFYTAAWFQFLLALLCINILAAAITRFPFSGKRVGFLLTHGAVVLILLGAWVTQQFAINGQLNLAEGQTADSFSVPADTLMVSRRSDAATRELDIPWIVGNPLQAVAASALTETSIDDVRFEVDRYLPDSEVMQVLRDGARNGRPAIEMSFSTGDLPAPTWVYADQVTPVGDTRVMFRTVANARALTEWLADAESTTEAPGNIVRVSFGGEEYRFDAKDCRKEAVAVGQTGLTLRVLRILPHAMVGSESRLTNASDRPVNPAVEVEVSFEGQTETRFAFAKFPDFQSMHASGGIANLKLFFDYSGGAMTHAPIELVGTPSGEIYAKFRPEDAPVETAKVSIGVPLDTPWSGGRLLVLRKFARAGMVRSVVPVENVRKDRTPAIHVRVTSPNVTHDLWVQRHTRSTINLAGNAFDVSYADAMFPLGFTVKLEQFTVGRYPGTERPRSFESRVTLVDATSGRTQSHVISMNHPLKFGGYTLYQSSYRYEKNRAISTLSVARDPGMAIVFVGYIAAILGMFVVLGLRLSQHRQADAPIAESAGCTKTEARRPFRISLIAPVEVCCTSDGNGFTNGMRTSRIVAQSRETMTRLR